MHEMFSVYWQACAHDTPDDHPYAVKLEEVEDRATFVFKKYGVQQSIFLEAPDKYLAPSFCVFCRTPELSGLDFRTQNKIFARLRAGYEPGYLGVFYSHHDACPGAARYGISGFDDFACVPVPGAVDAAEFKTSEELRASMVLEEFISQNSDLVAHPVDADATGVRKGQVQVDCKVCEVTLTSHLAHIMKHTQQHRDNDYVKLFVTDSYGWFRPEMHTGGGRLTSIHYPDGALSADGEHLTCRHCGEFKRVFKGGDEDLPSMGRTISEMNKHERKCKHKVNVAP